MGDPEGRKLGLVTRSEEVCKVDSWYHFAGRAPTVKGGLLLSHDRFLCSGQEG
jgi:hypothetical protein